MTLQTHVTRVYGPLLLLAYGAFLCSYFVFEDYSDPYRFYSISVFVLGLFVIARGVRSTWEHPLFRAILAYMAYFLLSCFWSEPFEWYRSGQKLTICVYLLAFITTTHYLVNRDTPLFDRMLQACTLVAALSAAIGIVVFYGDHPFPEKRMAAGIGALTNINEFANVYSVFAILALHFAMQSRRLPLKSAFFLAVAILVCVAWFGQSRTALASVSIALLALVILARPRGRLYYLAALVTLAAGLLILFPEVVDRAVLRGQGLRPFIWGEIWSDILAQPLFGHGLISMIAVETGKHSTTETAHNAYLQALWNGGLVGLALFLLVLGLGLRFAWSRARLGGDYRAFCILLFTAGAMLTGVDNVIDRPRDQLMLFWFPLALLLACECRPAAQPAALSLDPVPAGHPPGEQARAG